MNCDEGFTAQTPLSPSISRPVVHPAANDVVPRSANVQRPVDDNTSAENSVAYSLGIASLVVGIVALVISFMPCVGTISLPLSGLSLLLGIGGGVISISRNGHGVGFAIGGIGVSLMALLVGLFWLALMKGLAQTSTASHGAYSNESVEGAHTDSDQNTNANELDKWTDASKNPVVIDNVEVKIHSSRIDFVQVVNSGKYTFSRDKLLIVRIQIKNTSNTKKFEYTTWGKRHLFYDQRPTLRDNFGNKYFRCRWELGTRVYGQIQGQKSNYPLESLNDVLIFDPPVRKAECLRLELPASAIGKTGKIRFMIPRAIIKGISE